MIQSILSTYGLTDGLPDVYTNIIRKESMHHKMTSRKITRREYNEWWSQQNGYKNYLGYLNCFSQNNGYRDWTDYCQKHGNSKRVLKYQHTPKGYANLKKHKDKRQRELGNNVLNNDKIIDINYCGHHINHDDILYIPLDIHESVRPHSPFTGENMDIINKKSTDWYITYYGICSDFDVIKSCLESFKQ